MTDATNAEGIILDTSRYIYIDNITLFNYTLIGIKIAGSEDIMINNSKIYSIWGTNCGNGISMVSYGIPPDNITIENCLIMGCEYGVRAESPDITGVEILNNTFTNNDYGVYILNTNNLTVIGGCTFRDNNNYGIYIYNEGVQGGWIKIKDNKIINSSIGVSVPSVNLTFTNNEIEECQTGLVIRDIFFLGKIDHFRIHC